MTTSTETSPAAQPMTDYQAIYKPPRIPVHIASIDQTRARLERLRVLVEDIGFALYYEPDNPRYYMLPALRDALETADDKSALQERLLSMVLYYRGRLASLIRLWDASLADFFWVRWALRRTMNSQIDPIEYVVTSMTNGKTTDRFDEAAF